MELNYFTKNYQNTETGNNNIFIEFTKLTDNLDYLKEHKDFIQANNLGFGDRAFAYMWFLLLKHLQKHNEAINVLEIGVFKGQVISLWSLIAQKENISVNVNGISPLEGKPRDKNKVVKIFKYLTSKKYRQDIQAGNFYESADYLLLINKLFSHFGLDFSKVNLVKGYSSDPAVLEKFSNTKLDLVYVDGDHSYQGSLSDINHFSDKINQGGFLVIDDASCNIPGTVFWKGHQSVSDACEMIDSDKFKNILNVGHNRVFQKV